MKKTFFLQTFIFTTLFLAAIFAVSLSSCASNKKAKLPAWNTEGIESITLKPFEVSEDTDLQRQASEWLTQSAYSEISKTQAANRLDVKLISAEENISSGNNENIDNNNSNAIFTGRIINLTVSENTETENDAIIFERVAQLSFTYSLTADNGAVIGTRTIEDRLADYYELTLEEDEEYYDTSARQSRSRRTSSQTENLIDDYLKSPEILLQELIDKNMKDLGKIIF